MEKTTDLRGYLADLKKAKDDRREALANYEETVARYREAFVPLAKHPTADIIRRMHGLCPEDSVYPRSCILVCLALLWFAPESLFCGKLPMKLARTLSGELGVKPEAVYIQRNKVAAWLRVYPDFVDLVSDLFASLAVDGMMSAFQQ